jgi:glycosyltransferase involved in cell wall biosynthesis
MAFGLPVLGTDAGGTRDIIVPGETGLLHPVGEAGQEILSANILRLLRDRALARRMGEAGRERAHSHFSPEQFHRTFASALMLDQAIAPV